MKKASTFLYGIAIIAVLGVLSGFIGYTFPTQELKQTIVAENSHTHTTLNTAASATGTTIANTSQPEGCGCCAKRRAYLQKQRQQSGERDLAETRN